MVVIDVEAGRVEPPLPLRKNPQGGLGGEQRLADPLGPGDQPGVVEPPRIERVAEGGDGGIVAVERDHRLPSREGTRSSTAASSLAVTSSGAPPASIRRKRSGSSSANRAKASATRP
jgi:hypothetical protein